MKRTIFLFLSLACIPLFSFSQPTAVKALLAQVPADKHATSQTQIMFLGCSHFGQEGLYKGNPAADLFSPEKQTEIAGINRQFRFALTRT